MVTKLRRAFQKARQVFQKVRVVYYNFGDGSDAEKLADLEYAAEHGADLIGISEHADRVDVTSAFLRLYPEYDRYFDPNQAGGAKECILWRKSLGTVTLKKTTRLTGPMKLPKGAGPENAGPKCIHRIRIRVKTGKRRSRRVHFMVGHQYATIHKRKQAARLFMNALVNVVRARLGVVILVSDQNATPGQAILEALKVLLPSWSNRGTGPTHKNRIIDYIMVRGAKIIEAWSHKLSSDHKMIFADVKL